jgi:hypothetical protein
MRFFLLLIICFGFLFGEKISSSYNYSYYPQKGVYENQIFSITILGKNIDQNSSRVFLNTQNALYDNFKIITKKPVIKKAKNDLFFTFYFKANKKSALLDQNIILPPVVIKDKNAKTFILKSLKIPLKKLEVKRGIPFSGVIASKLKVIDYKILPKNSIALKIKAENGNLEDFFLPKTLERKVLYLKRKGSFSEAKFIFHLKKAISHGIDFTYYNNLKQSFSPVTIGGKHTLNTSIKENLNLKPKDSSFLKFKKYTFGFLSVFFLMLFFISKDKFYLWLFGIVVVIFLTFFMPLKKVCVKEGARVYILPIPNSTIGKIINHKGQYTVYHRYKNFSKIEYEDGLIGWVKDEDLCKD